MRKTLAVAPNYLTKEEKAILEAKKRKQGLSYAEAHQQVRKVAGKVFKVSRDVVIDKEVDKKINKNKNFKTSFKDMVAQMEQDREDRRANGS